MDSEGNRRSVRSECQGSRQGFKEIGLDKKKKTYGYKERDEVKREAYQRKLAEYEGRVILYIDESGCDERINYEYGWSLKGEKIEDFKDGSRGKRTSILAAYQKGELVTPLTFEGSCNRAVIEKWLEEQLLPQCTEGTVLVMDNASFHKGGKIKELIEEAKCELLYLAPYSPDMNPIEKCWGWLKRIIRRERKHHENIRETVDYVIANLS